MLGRASILLLTTVALGTGTHAMAQDTKPVVPPKSGERAVPVNEPWLHEAGQLIGAKIKEGNDELGEVENFVFDAVTGECRYAKVGLGGVLGVGEDKAVVPIELLKLQHDPESKKVWYRFTTDRAKLTGAPKMPDDISSPTNAGWEKSILAHYGVKRDVSSASALLDAKHIKEMNLHGMDGKKLGEIEHLYLDAGSFRIAAFVLGAGGLPALGEKDYAMPWDVVKIARDENGKPQLRTTVTEDLLSRAPEFEEKMLPDREWMHRVYTYYSVRPFWPAAAEAGFDKKGSGSNGNPGQGGR